MRKKWTMTEHTRELSVEAHDEPEEFWFPNGYVSVRSSDGVIAILGGEEAHYANMFAAAPDLLAALVAVARASEGECPWCIESPDGSHEYNCLSGTIRAAIARARGEG